MARIAVIRLRTWATCTRPVRGWPLLVVIPKLTDVIADIEQADALVLPGDGAFDPAMQHLRSRDLIQPIKDRPLPVASPSWESCIGLTALVRLQRRRQGTWSGASSPATFKKFRQRAQHHHPPHGLEPAHPDPTRYAPLEATLKPGIGCTLFTSYYAEPTDAAVIAASGHPRQPDGGGCDRKGQCHGHAVPPRKVCPRRSDHSYPTSSNS